MDKLPDDALSNIFIRLPAKLVAQMRCVSKPLSALLSQPNFIRYHLDYSIHNNNEIVMIFYTPFSFRYKPFAFRVHPCQSPHLELTNFIKLPLNIPYDHDALYDVIGSVNGLICFMKQSDLSSHHVIHIWNPSLSALLTLPPYTMPSFRGYQFDIHFRFGFDPKTDDYKVVKLVSPLRPSCNSSGLEMLFGTLFYVAKEWLQVEVFSMRNGSWKSITQRFPSHITRIIDTDEFCGDGHDGRLHWLCRNNETEVIPQTIVAFDLGVENFSEISLPKPIQELKYNLGVLGGKLCMMLSITDGDFEVWVMDEYGVAESWVKHHDFSHFSSDIIPFGFTLNNEFVCEAYSRLVLYDPVAAMVKSFRVDARLMGKTKIVQYVDSLVWVAPTMR